MAWGLAAGRASALLGLPSSCCARRQQCATYSHAGEWGCGYECSISCCGSCVGTVTSRVLRRGEQGWGGEGAQYRLRLPAPAQPLVNVFRQQHSLNTTPSPRSLTLLVNQPRLQ